MSPSLPTVRVVPIMLALLAALLALTGCRPPYEARHDAIPGPVGTVETVSAALDERVPLTPAEWAAVDAALDSYHRGFEELRVTTIAPYAREVHEDRGRRWLADDVALSRLDRKAQSVAHRVRALDDTLYVDLVAALPARASFVERLSARRAIDRALRLAAGSDERGVGQGFTDLDIEVGGLLARPALAERATELRATLEPLRAAYRTELANAASVLAEALLEFPSDRLKALHAAGIPQERIDSYVRGGGQSGSNEERQALQAAVRKSQHRILRAQVAIDDLNARTLEAWSAVLPPDAAEWFGSEATFRRAEPEGAQPLLRWYSEVLEVLPEVSNGRAPRTAAAVKALRAATDDYARIATKAWRARATQRTGSTGAEATPAETERLKQAQQAVQNALQAATKVGDEELKPETLEKLRALLNASAVDGRTMLNTLVGRTQAARLMARAPRTMFLVPEVQEERFDDSRSFALQILLGPMASRTDFDRVAASLGARPNDAIVEELWVRYSERAEALNKTQDEALRSQEKRAQDMGEQARDDPAAFEREVADYIRALMAADDARGQLMVDTLYDLAAGRGVSADDPRLKVARAQLAVARAAVPWRRFQLPWLVGPLWMAQADLLALVAAVTPDDPVVSAAVLGVAVTHAADLEQVALQSRMAGFEALRDFLSLVLKMQRQGRTDDMSPDEIPTLPAVQSLIRRVREAATARTDVQLSFLVALEPVLGAERSFRLRASYATATFPEFFAENAWYEGARDLANAMDSGRPGPGDDAARNQASAAVWHDNNIMLVERVLQWQRSPTSAAPPLRAPDLASIAMEDAELGTLRTLRDEYTLRLLRDVAVAAGEPPHSRMPGAIRLVSRPPVTLQP